MMHLRPRNILGGALFLFTVAVFLVFHTQYEAIRSYIPSRTSHKNAASNGPGSAYVDLAPLPTGYAHLLSGLRLPAQLEAYPLLHQRLHAFLSRPVRSYDAARPLNERLCPRDLSDRLVNPDQLNGDGEFWREEVDEEMIRKKRVEMVEYLVKVIERGDKVVWDVEEDEKIQQAEILADINPDIARRAPLPTSYSQRGFVSAAGNSDTTQRLLTLVRILRKHYHSTLPFQVWTFPDELSHDSAEYIELTEELGATVHETKGLVKDPGAWKNFQIKGLAITSSSFRELVYLDSDNIPLRDPTKLFNSERYLDQGAKAAFWPDLSKDHVDNAIWRIIGDECTLDDWTFESGQIVIDKAGNSGLNLAALHLAAYMQSDHDFWFRMCGGDKDTFRWAFRALDIPFATSPMWAVPLGQRNPFEGERFCGHTVLQYDLDVEPGEEEPRPLFVHSNLLKHISGVGRGQTFTHLKRMTNHSYTAPTLNYVHQWVYQGVARGMCTDLAIWDSDPQLPEEEAANQHVELQALSDLPGQPFDKFEDMFFDEGGRAGGWRRRKRRQVGGGSK